MKQSKPRFTENGRTTTTSDPCNLVPTIFRQRPTLATQNDYLPRHITASTGHQVVRMWLADIVLPYSPARKIFLPRHSSALLLPNHHKDGILHGEKPLPPTTVLLGIVASRWQQISTDGHTTCNPIDSPYTGHLFGWNMGKLRNLPGWNMIQWRNHIGRR